MTAELTTFANLPSPKVRKQALVDRRGQPGRAPALATKEKRRAAGTCRRRRSNPRERASEPQAPIRTKHKRAARSYGEPHLVQAAQWSRLFASAATRREAGVSVELRRLAGLGSKTGWQPVRESRGLELEHSAALTG